MNLSNYRLISVLFTVFIMISPVKAESTEAVDTFSANFQGTDIHEFINTVSKNLGKTIIIDNSVSGQVTVRSYEKLSKEEYYQFFLNVLDVYGYTVINMPNNILKVVPSAAGKRAAVTGQSKTASGDELIMRVVPLHYTEARDIAPLLGQLNDSAGVGNVAHYEKGNALFITGRANVVDGLVKLAKEMDNSANAKVESIRLLHASAAEVARMVSTLYGKEGGVGSVRVTADERTNAVLISGDESVQKKVRLLIQQLDREQVSQGSTKVIRLRYANAKSLVDVLTGVSAGLQEDNKASEAAISVMKNVVIKADEQTNSLIINASPDMMHNLENVIEQLDVRRAQVLVEAVIVEMNDAEGFNLGIQWGHKDSGGTQFSNAQSQISKGFDGGMSEVFKNANGLVTGFYNGNWSGLLTAISNTSKNNILATPSIVTLDNETAEFNVGQDVPILTGSQTTNNDNIFNTVSRKTVGVKLKVKPQINKDKTVLLQIEQEVSSVVDSATNQSLGATFNVRTVNNSVMIESGETVVLGGLLDKSQTDTESGVPVLKDIPLIGNLFKASSHNNSKRNLILFIRPTIIRSSGEYNTESVMQASQFQRNDEFDKPLNNNVDDQLSSISNQLVFMQAKQNISEFFEQGGQ